MANVIHVDVYNFDSTGNSYVSKKAQGLPTQGLFVSGVGPAPTSGVYVYSKLTYPALGLGGKEYLTAESVSSIITKANA